MSEQLNIKEIISIYQYDNKLKRFSNVHFFNDNSIYSKVKDNEDVERAASYFDNSFEYYKKIFPLEREDIQDLEKGIAKYEIAVRKVIACFYNPNTNFNYSSEELSKLINGVFERQEKVDQIRLRKAMQD